MFNEITEHLHSLDPKMSVSLPLPLYLTALRLTSIPRCDGLQTYHQYLSIIDQALITSELD